MACHLPDGFAIKRFNLFAVEEHYQANKLLKENAQAIRNLIARYGKQDRTLLHQGAEESQNTDEVISIQSAYSREQVQTIWAQKASTGVGLDLIKEHLRVDSNRKNSFTQERGSPRLFISRQRCPNLWREMMSLKLSEEDGRVRYIRPDYAVTNLRNVLMTRPKPGERPGSEKEATKSFEYSSPWL